MIEYKETFLIEDHEYLSKIFQDHYEEVKPPVLPDVINLDYNQILQLEEAKAFVSIKAIKNNETVGLVSGYIYPHMHYKGVMFATTSFLQAHKALGRERVEVIKGLVKKFEEVCKEKHNVKYIQVGLSASKDIRRLFPEYETTDITISKRI